MFFLMKTEAIDWLVTWANGQKREILSNISLCHPVMSRKYQYRSALLRRQREGKRNMAKNRNRALGLRSSSRFPFVSFRCPGYFALRYVSTLLKWFTEAPASTLVFSSTGCRDSWATRFRREKILKRWDCHTVLHAFDIIWSCVTWLQACQAIVIHFLII